MAEFEEKLNAILSDPQAMGQIASLAQALTGEHAGESAPPPAAEPVSYTHLTLPTILLV